MLITTEGLHQIDTHRRHPRSLREAFPIDDRTSCIGIAGPVVIRTRSPWWLRILQLFNLNRSPR